MLFGALGIKAPTNEKEANEARSKLIKGIRPTKELDRNTESSYSSSELQVESEDLTAWESVINYRAVECCRPGMPLTKPPFPFVQRWDPQQQRGNKRRTDHQRNASHYYEGAYSASNPKRRKGTHNYDAEAPDSLQYDDLVATSGAQDGDVEKEVGQQLQHENQTVQSEASQAPDDLVVLPNDPSTLPDLLDGVAQARMVIAFRQLEMSEATMWQPQMSPYKTAIVIDVLDDDRLDMLLAKRDRVRSEKLYDYDTGERIYGKFEMPVEIEDNDDDDGRLCLTFAELVEPKIVVGLTVEAVQDTNVNEISQPKDQPSRDESATLSHEVPSHEEEPTEAQFSHVTETVLDLDAQEPRSPKVDNTNDVEAKNPDSPDPQNQNSADLETSGRPDAETCPELSLDEAMDEIPEIVDSLPDAQLEITDMSVDALNGPSALQDEAEARIVAEQGTIPHISTVLEVSEASMIGAEEFSTTANAAETIAKNMPKSVAASIIGTEEEAECHRKEFSKHIKELGFRSTISSSTMRELRPNDMETPAAVVFIQTEQDMAEIEQGSSYSPTFNGFGTSPSSAENHKDSPSPAARQPSKFPQPSPKLPSKSPSSQVPKETSRSPKAVPQLSSGSSEPPQSSWQTVDEGNEDYWEDPDEDGDGMSSVDAAESEMESSDGEQNDIILDLETKDREFDIDMLTDVEKSARASPMNVEEFTAGELSRLQEPNRSARVASVSGASRCPEMRPTELQETSQKLRTRLVSWASESRNIASRSVPGALVTNPEPRATRSRSASRASSSRASEPGDSKSRSISRAPILRASEPRAAKTRSPSRASMSRASEQMESNSRSASRLSGIRASDHGDSRTKSVSRATALQASELVDSQSRSVSVSKVSDQIPTKSMSVSKPASRGSTSRGSPPPETSTKVSKTASSVRAAKSPSAQAQESKITTTTKRRSIKLIRPPISKAAEIWKSFDTKPPTSDDASGSNNPSYGFSLDGIDEREPDSIEYPKLSVSSSFTSQVTDHGRQPDFNFDESVATNADTSMLPSLPNVDANGGTVSEADLTRVEQSGSLSKNVLQKKKASNPPKQSTRCIMPLLEGDGSDSDFPDIKDICSQPLPRREKTTPVRRSKVKPPVEADVAEDSENSSKRNSWRRKSLSVVQRQVSNGGEKLESHPLASQPQQPVPSSQRASQYSAPSQIIDLISSEEDESESSVPKVPTLKKFRDIGAEDGNQYSKGRASKSPKRTPKARRGSDVRLKVSSQASNKGRKQTYAK
ncbi:hypothetical protein BJ875DRAFT_469585 [Amylocarpus encephaloides]|uniref:Uncharacterized protein n=1 Tax=Amylocarpus encephaloides TaxID=45428 RepID=A0A9P8C2F1_9HELO|nr:hypothetical protein BJ875DRAFT_469585 [Amylocarpus encephaloides]